MKKKINFYDTTVSKARSIRPAKGKLGILLPGRGAVVFGVGMLGRFLLVAVSALVLVPVAGLAPAPTLLALVSVLFGPSLLEPVFLAADTRNNAR